MFCCAKSVSSAYSNAHQSLYCRYQLLKNETDVIKSDNNYRVPNFSLKNIFFTNLLPHHRCEHGRRRRRHRQHRPRRVNDVIQHLAPGLDRIVGQHVLQGGHRLVGSLGPGIIFFSGGSYSWQ